MPNDLSLDALERILPPDFGRPFRYFETIGSTNTEAAAWAARDAPHGALVVTDHQEAGRGRWGRDWASAPGSLLQFSLILRPRIEIASLGLLTIAAGVACAEGIEATTALETRLKWPNDVIVADRKCAGILLETMMTGASLSAVIIGIGVNVAWSEEGLPQDLRATAIDIKGALGGNSTPDRSLLLAAILERIRHWSGVGASDDVTSELLEEAARRSTVLGHAVDLRLMDDTTRTAVATGLAGNGGLEVQLPDGSTEVVSIAEIRQVRPA